MDIVIELRKDAEDLLSIGLPREPGWRPLSYRAAEEIERLRAAISMYCPEYPDPVAITTDRGKGLWAVIESIKRRS